MARVVEMSFRCRRRVDNWSIYTVLIHYFAINGDIVSNLPLDELCYQMPM